MTGLGAQPPECDGDLTFWINDGDFADAQLWRSGMRVYSASTKGLSPNSSSTVLVLGCGAGRIAKAALLDAGRVIAFECCTGLMEKSRSLQLSNPRLELFPANGRNLEPTPSSSIDLAISFSTLSQLPPSVCANYLAEIARVLKPGGLARLQFFVVDHQAPDNSFGLRCYSLVSLSKAIGLAGLELQGVESLTTPLPLLEAVGGIQAKVLALRKSSGSKPRVAELTQSLIPTSGCKPGGEVEPNRDLEYLCALTYAKQLLAAGETQLAIAALELAQGVPRTEFVEADSILSGIEAALRNSGSAAVEVPETATLSATGLPLLDQNLELLGKKFPNLAQSIIRRLGERKSDAHLTSKETPQGQVLYSSGQCLDHPEKPRAAGESWARKLIGEERFEKCNHVVVIGLGSGYHIEELLKAIAERGAKKEVSVIEPDAAVLLAALRNRSAQGWLAGLHDLVLTADGALPGFDGEYELWIRPQTQNQHVELCEKIRSLFYGQRGLNKLSPTIGVVGPLQGGTLPIMEYVARSLLMLGQRTRMYDLSCFDQGYLSLEKFVFDKTRRKGIEAVYTEMVSQVVLDSVNEKPLDILFCMALAPVSPRVLQELRNRGVITVLWFVEDFARFTYWREYARYYDFIFTIQKGRCIEALKAAGAGEVHYMPVACDPAVHSPVQLTDEERARWGGPVTFMGAGYHNRQQIFASMADMPLKIFGSEWPTCRPFDRLVQEGGRRLTPAEYIKIFSASDININLHSSHERDGVDPFGDFLNPRTFELASVGAFQLVDKRSLLAESFEPGREVVTFESAAQLKDQIRYYMDHPEERRAIAENARKRALSEHTYQHRLKEMLSIIYSSRYEQLKQRLDQGPWQRMLRRARPHTELYERCLRSFKRGEEPNLDGLVSDIVTGQGKLSETEQKLLFLFHVTKQIIRMTRSESGEAQQ